MQHIFASMRRLHDRGTACRGLVVDWEGVALGPECILVRRTPHGYRRAGDREIVQFAREAFGDQPRDDHGRWTSEGPSSSAAGLLDSNKLPGKTLPEAGGSFLGPLASDALIGLGMLALRLTAATVIFRILFIPSNRSLISEGSVPNHPDMTYRYDSDTGELSFYREGERRKPFFIGSADPDGIFRDGTGQPVARKSNGVVIIDPDALPFGSERPANQNDNPKLCPAPKEENIEGRSEQALRYQEQITGLPRGLDVELNGVRYDGCRLSDGHMLEAKGSNYEWAMVDDTTWQSWYTGTRKLMHQMEDQSRAAPNRIVEWHFAEERVAKFFDAYAKVN